MTETRAEARARRREAKEAREAAAIPTQESSDVDTAKPKARGTDRRSGKISDETARAMVEARERREAEEAALLRDAVMVRAQRDTAVAALEVLAAAVHGSETSIEKAQRLLAEAALRRVQHFATGRRSPAFALREEANADGD